MNEIRAISVFVRAAALGSLRQAAIEQGIAPQAASLAVMQLEKHLGTRLFHRTTRRLSLTEEGARFLDAAKPGLDMLVDALMGARHATDTVAGPLRVSAPRSAGPQIVWPAVAAFMRQHPQVDVDLQLDDRFSDWVAERIDVGIRGGVPPDGRLIARRLMPIQLIVCASPAYLARHGEPERIEDLAAHRCTGYRQSNTGRLAPWEFDIDGQFAYREIPARFCTTDPEVETLAVLEGHAIGQLASFSAVPHIRAGRLRPLLLRHLSDRQGMYLCYGRRTQLALRVRAFIDFMMEHLGNNPEFVLTPDDIRSVGGAARKRRAPARRTAA